MYRKFLFIFLIVAIIKSFVYIHPCNAKSKNYWIASVPKNHDFTVLYDIPHKTGECFVRFAPTSEGNIPNVTNKLAILNSSGGGNIKRNYKLVPGLTLVKLPQGLTVKQALQTYNKTKGIIYAEPNYEIKLLSKYPADPNFPQLWGMHNIGQAHPIEGGGTSYGTVDADIDAPEAWGITTDSNIVVAVLDTGIDYDHPDLEENLWINEAEYNGVPNVDDDNNGYIDDVYGWDFADNDSDPNDYYFHGTHCAGTIGAIGNNEEGVVGVCWSVKIMNLKIFPNYDNTSFISGAIEAIEYGIFNGATVLNNSWGGFYYSHTLKEEVAKANEAGVIFVAAAGNYDVDNDNPSYPFYPYNVANYPSSYDCENIIAIMATDHNADSSHKCNK